MNDLLNRIHIGDALTILKTWPDEFVDCVVTSPPYWGLRDYGIEGQLGLEKTPEEYVAKMVEVFREVKRVLKKEGTLWLNLGDSYAGSMKGSGGNDPERSCKQVSNPSSYFGDQVDNARKFDSGLKPKDLVGIPWRVAFALQQPYRVPVCVNNEIDRAWLAAMFDGEGTIGIRRYDSYRGEVQYQDGFVVYTSVTNSDIELLDRCIEITGKGKVALKQKADTTDDRGIISRRDSYGWRLDGNDAVDIIRAVYPYLISKRKQAQLAFTLDAINKDKHRVEGRVPKEDQDKKIFLYESIKKCNQREQVDIPNWIKEPIQKIEPGWYLRSDIIWAKPNPMPESVRDRPTKAHEYIFLLSKSQKYYFDQDAVREPHARLWDETNAGSWSHPVPTKEHGKSGYAHSGDYPLPNPSGRNIRTVWNIAT